MRKSIYISKLIYIDLTYTIVKKRDGEVTKTISYINNLKSYSSHFRFAINELFLTQVKLHPTHFPITNI